MCPSSLATSKGSLEAEHLATYGVESELADPAREATVDGTARETKAPFFLAEGRSDANSFTSFR
jgi:hypothetical protein